MTQFALIRSRAPIEGSQHIVDLKNPFLLKIASELFSDNQLNQIYVPNFEGKDIDELMCNAQKDLIDKKAFNDTSLFTMVKKIASSVDEIVFWYGSDYADLTYVNDVATLLTQLESAAKSSFCEVYLHYKNL